VLPSPAAWLCLAHRDAPAIQGHSRCMYRGRSSYTGTFLLGQVPGTKVAAGGKMGPVYIETSTSSQVDRRQVHLDFGPDSNRRYLLSDIRPCLAIRPCPNSIACVQTSYKTMVIYCRFYGRGFLCLVTLNNTFQSDRGALKLMDVGNG
jgi:hypothetical protein